MATVTKTWTFTSDTEGLADEGITNDILFSHDAGDAAVKFTSIKKDNELIEGGLNGSTGETWESWGVPVGATVTNIQVTGWLERTVANTKLGSHDITADILGSGTVPVPVSTTPVINAFSLSTTTSPTFTSQGPETQQAVISGKQASNTDVRLRLRYHMIMTGGGGSASLDWRMDTIELEITYTIGGVVRRIFHIN